jgi:hypothetical protein
MLLHLVRMTPNSVGSGSHVGRERDREVCLMRKNPVMCRLDLYPVLQGLLGRNVRKDSRYHALDWIQGAFTYIESLSSWQVVVVPGG